MASLAKHVWVSGRVQGVAFRHHARERARELGLVGWVRNVPDGRVEAWIEGAETPVSEMMRWLEIGPPAAEVHAVEASDREPAGLERFEVRR